MPLHAGSGAVKIPSKVPRLLCLDSPNGHMTYIGEYALIAGELINGLPLWKHRAGSRWIYSGADCKWHVGGQDAKDLDFNCQLGVIHSGVTHAGETPDKVPGHWVRKYGSELYEDVAIKVKVISSSSQAISSRLRIE